MLSCQFALGSREIPAWHTCFFCMSMSLEPSYRSLRARFSILAYRDMGIVGKENLWREEVAQAFSFASAFSSFFKSTWVAL